MDKQEHQENHDMSYLTSDELKQKFDSNTPLMVLDLRDSKDFERSHIPGSSWAVCNEDSKKNIMPRLPKDVEIVLVGQDDKDEFPKQMSEMMRQMGLKAKYLKGGISYWKWGFNQSPYDKDISATSLKKLLDSPNDKEQLFLLDVREPNEYKQWNIEGSINIPLSKLSEQESIGSIPRDKRIITICPRGNRSTIGKYLLERYGYHVESLGGGLRAWSSSFEYASSEYIIQGSSKVKLIQFRRIGKGCMSYLLDSDGQSIVIDPVYPIDDYIQKASEIGTTITKVFDTHQHADHVSAARDLAKKVGILYYQSSYENYIDEGKGDKQVKEGDIIALGKVKIKVIHTPGHTNGSVSFLVDGVDEILNNDDMDNNNNNNKKTMLLFAGDTLFVDGVGRPDLRDKARESASFLFDTLNNKLFVLPKNTIILPAHFGRDTNSQHTISSTLEEVQNKGKELLKLDKQTFVDRVSSVVTPSPSNFKEIIAINTGVKPVPPLAGVYELEIGPNRCGISM
ncbi:MAG: rhodanese-like domain-containing protein [Thermoproteota archaeon]|nr:rhodanese-like domain-containing protein [Thermoproteota archaeon]